MYTTSLAFTIPLRLIHVVRTFLSISRLSKRLTVAVKTQKILLAMEYALIFVAHCVIIRR